MAPAAPHTIAREARSCMSCHGSTKAVGYGTHDGRYMKSYVKGVSVDLATAQGDIVSRNARVQISPIPELPMDLDQVVTREDEQVQTVGHHWPLSGPLPKEMRDRVEQTGVCIVCHEELPAMSWGKVHRKSFHFQEMKRLLPSGKSFHEESEESGQK